jgi:hypothetical protein
VADFGNAIVVERYTWFEIRWWHDQLGCACMLEILFHFADKCGVLIE